MVFLVCLLIRVVIFGFRFRFFFGSVEAKGSVGPCTWCSRLVIKVTLPIGLVRDRMLLARRLWVSLLASKVGGGLANVVPRITKHMHRMQIWTISKIWLLYQFHFIEIICQGSLFKIRISLVRCNCLLSAFWLHWCEWGHDEGVCGEGVGRQVIEGWHIFTNLLFCTVNQ